MFEKPRVTVVIPAYKAEATICRAVESVLVQEDVDVHVIVVVDGLLDCTTERLKKYDSPRVTVLLNPENRGAQVSRNRGLEVADGDFIMFLDCDDFIEGSLLKGLVDALRQNEADIAFGPMRQLKMSHGNNSGVIHRSYESADDLFRRWMAHGETLSPCAIMWRTAFLREIGGWNEPIRRNQDGEVVMRTILKGAQFSCSREGCGVYVIHDSIDRVTKRPENLPSSLDVGDALMAMDSSAVSEDAKREGLAGYFHRIALRLYAVGRPDLGDRALQRARELGLDVDRLAWHRRCAKLIGLPFRHRIFALDHSGRMVWFLLGLTARIVKHSSTDGWLRLRSF